MAVRANAVVKNNRNWLSIIFDVNEVEVRFANL